MSDDFCRDVFFVCLFGGDFVTHPTCLVPRYLQKNCRSYILNSWEISCWTSEVADRHSGKPNGQRTSTKNVGTWEEWNFRCFNSCGEFLLLGRNLCWCSFFWRKCEFGALTPKTFCVNVWILKIWHCTKYSLENSRFGTIQGARPWFLSEPTRRILKYPFISLWAKFACDSSIRFPLLIYNCARVNWQVVYPILEKAECCRMIVNHPEIPFSQVHVSCVVRGTHLRRFIKSMMPWAKFPTVSCAFLNGSTLNVVTILKP